MAELIRTDEVLAPHHLMELFQCDGDEYDGPDLDDVNVQAEGVQVCDGVWKRDPCGELWRFWKFEDAS